MMMQNGSFKEQLFCSQAILEEKIVAVKVVQKNIKSIKSQMDSETKGLKSERKTITNKKNRLSREKYRVLKEFSNETSGKGSTEKNYTLKIDAMQQEIDAINTQIASIEETYNEKFVPLKNLFPSDTALPEDVMYYFYSDILTTVKKARTEEVRGSGEKIGHDDIDHKNIARGIVAKDAKKIIKVAQKALANLSVNFLQAEAANCQSSDKVMLKSIVSRVKVVKHHYHGSHNELPCFHYTRVVFQRAMEQQIPIILKVRNFKGDPFTPKDFSNYTMFKVNTSEMKYEPAPHDSISPDSLAIVMECRTSIPADQIGKSSYIEEILSKTGGIIPLIEHLVAQHTQYTDQKKMTESFEHYYDEVSMPEGEKKRVIAMGHHAITTGISPNDPSLCCPEHIYCTTFGNEMKLGVSHEK